MENKIPTVFISYSWDSENHKAWVRKLSEELSLHGIRTIIDQKDLQLGDHLTLFMERSIKESDFILIICTPTYKEKADRRIGGVGYEESIITSDVLINLNNRKYITVLASGNWISSVPTWAESKYGADLSSEGTYKNEFAKIVSAILGGDVRESEKEKTNTTPSYEHLFRYFKDAPESLQIALLQNICNICSQIDILESYGVLEDFCMFLDQIDTSITLNDKVKTIHVKVKNEVERMLLEDMEDLWQGR